MFGLLIDVHDKTDENQGELIIGEDGASLSIIVATFLGVPECSTWDACLLVGTCLSGLGIESDLEGTNFIDGYPEPFRDSKEFIAGLIVEAELRRLDTEKYSDRDFEREIAKLLDVNSPTRLSEGAGLAKANLYSAGGFEFILEKLQPKPVSAQEFLLRFHDLWEQEVHAR